MPYYCTFWDWKEDPPLREIESRINALLDLGARRIALRFADTQADHHGLLIADQNLSDKRASNLWDKWFEALPEAPYDWKKDPDPQPGP